MYTNWTKLLSSGGLNCVVKWKNVLLNVIRKDGSNVIDQVRPGRGKVMCVIFSKQFFLMADYFEWLWLWPGKLIRVILKDIFKEMDFINCMLRNYLHYMWSPSAVYFIFILFPVIFSFIVLCKSHWIALHMHTVPSNISVYIDCSILLYWDRIFWRTTENINIFFWERCFPMWIVFGTVAKSHLWTYEQCFCKI
jgi:hypothetical protein